MVFAQIKDGVVQNTIVLNDNSLINLFNYNPTTSVPYDLVLQVDMLYPQPGIGWTFDGIMFAPPADEGSYQEFLDGTVSLLFSKSASGISVGTYLNSGSVASSNSGQSAMGHSNLIGLSATNVTVATSLPMVFQLQRRIDVDTFEDIPGATISIPVGSYSATINFSPYIVIDGNSEISVCVKDGSSPTSPIVQVHLG